MQIGCTKGQGESVRSMDALTLMWVNGYFINIWTTNTGFAWRYANLVVLLLVLGGPRQQNHHAMNVRILSNPHVRQKRNEKKAFDTVKNKVELEWDELQTQVQQMEQVKRPLLVRLVSKILLGIIWIPARGVGFIPQSAWARLEKDKNLVETIRISRITYAKPLKIAWGVQNWTLEFNKRNRVKEMDVISKYHDSKIIHGRYISILIYIYKTLFAS